MLYLKRLPGLILMASMIFNPLSCAHQVIDYNDRSSADVVVDDNGNDLLFTSNNGSIILYHDEVNGNSSSGGCQSQRIKSITVSHTLVIPETLFSEATPAKLISLDKYKPGERVKSGLFYTIVNTGNVTVDAYKMTIKLPKYFEYIDIHGYNVIVPIDEKKITCRLVKDAGGISELHVSVNESLETDRRHRIFITGTYVIPDIKQKTDK